ncbi:vacuolar membrane protein-domain-containing protein [Chaetomidium leptoderma]|uniref:Vacuolar membrane protein-domain-containing protein n=1 Tax=Chaetomidium leptoderma TaxID=669021 RepID=A0AAN6VCJ8_9PEZI|nr:vacuolar membrane protein-domain-containing protein [Chaetomidium leptoderma]
MTTPTSSIILTHVTAAAASATATGSPTDGPAKPTECSLLGPFAILVQLALGALALLALVYKRWRERPQRPVRIWFFDVSKQVFGSVLVHAANVFMSLLTSGRIGVDPVVPGVGSAGTAAAAVVVVRRAVAAVVGGGLGLGMSPAGLVVGRAEEGGDYVPNPCSFYLLNLGIDTTMGIPILIVIVRVLTRLVASTPLGNPPESIQSGNYGTPPNAWWWLKQSLIYFCGLMGMKLVVLVMFMVLPWLPHIGDWALGWTEGNEKLQIVFVMMLFPLIMNALQYYIIDSYIKKQEAVVVDGEAGAGAGGPVVYEELAVSETDESGDEEEDDGNDDARKTTNASRGSQLQMARRNSATGHTNKDVEYDPAVDGDSQTVIGSSSSHVSNRGTPPKELLPRE